MFDSANNHKLAWSRVRSHLDILERNKVFPESTTQRLLNQAHRDIKNNSLKIRPLTEDKINNFLDISANDSLCSSLESLYITYPPNKIKVFEDLGFEKLTHKEKRQKLGLGNGMSKLVDKNSPEGRLNKMLLSSAYIQKKAMWQYRIGEACIQYRNWHPFFITLTIDPKIIEPRVLWQETREWQKYIKRIANISMKCAGLLKKERRLTSNRKHVQYVALIEHGKSGHHDHIHCLMFIKHVPEDWKIDPNEGLYGQFCTNRRCLQLELNWPWSLKGLSPAIYFRFIGDIWTTYGHKIPLDKDGKSLQLMPPESSGGYVIKYMDKTQERKWKHRIKRTEGIGLDRLKEQINNMNLEHLQQLSLNPPTFSQSLIQKTILSVPNGLVKLLSKTRIYQLTYKKMNLKTLTQLLPKPYLGMLQSVKNGVMPWRLNIQDFYDWLQSVLPPAKIEFSETIWLEALSTLSNFLKKDNLVTNTLGAL